MYAGIPKNFFENVLCVIWRCPVFGSTFKKKEIARYKEAEPHLFAIFKPLARQINCRLLNFSPSSIFKVLQSRSKFVKMLSECQKAWSWVRRRVTQRLIQIQAFCIWDYSRAWWSKG